MSAAGGSGSKCPQCGRVVGVQQGALAGFWSSRLAVGLLIVLVFGGLAAAISQVNNRLNRTAVERREQEDAKSRYRLNEGAK